MRCYSETGKNRKRRTPAIPTYLIKRYYLSNCIYNAFFNNKNIKGSLWTIWVFISYTLILALRRCVLSCHTPTVPLRISIISGCQSAQLQLYSLVKSAIRECVVYKLTENSNLNRIMR